MDKKEVQQHVSGGDTGEGGWERNSSSGDSGGNRGGGLVVMVAAGVVVTMEQIKLGTYTIPECIVCADLRHLNL